MSKKVVISSSIQTPTEAKKLQALIKKLGHKATIVKSEVNKTVPRNDLLISLGGDGTFLHTVHNTQGNTPILGINADPKHKEGFLLQLPKKDLKKELTLILDNQYKLKYLPTLEIAINGKKLSSFAVNEFFVGSPVSYCTSRYQLQFKGKKETQRSSGVIIATSIGANAWLYSAQQKKKKVPTNGAAYVVREPYEGRVFKYKLKHGMIKSNESITFISKMKKAIVVPDSLPKEHVIKYDDRITIAHSHKTIPIIVPK